MDYKKEIANLAAQAAGVPAEGLESFLEIPPQPEMGDYALPCFKLAKIMRKPPQAISAQLAADIEKPTFISRIESAGGYLNFYIERLSRARSVLECIAEQGARYGGSDEGANKTICIDYSSINIAKKCHIGHLTTTALGHSLYRLYNFLGYKCVGINHLGDWGTQFGKLICAYKLWGSRQEVERAGIDELVKLYVRFNQEADQALEDEARAWFKKIEDDDQEAVEIFTWFKEITLRDVARIYSLLGITFDSYAGESFYKDKWQAVVAELEQKGLLEESEGAQVVKLDDYSMPPCIIIKKDGASLYSTRDIAAAIYRKQEYDFYKCLYVVAYQQTLHFKQVFKVLELMGRPWAKDLVHVPFGMVSFEGQTLSTRKGQVVYLEEFLNKAINKALALINEKNPSLENKEQIARQVGVGAVIFYDLYSSRIKDVDFWWDRALNFDGETGPYVQYTHVRCTSVLAKANLSESQALAPVNADFSALENDEAGSIIALLESFPSVVRTAAEKYEPSILLHHAISLAQAYNKYYFEHRILEGEPAQTAAKLMLTAAVRQVLRTGLSLAGIEAPDRM